MNKLSKLEASKLLAGQVLGDYPSDWKSFPPLGFSQEVQKMTAKELYEYRNKVIFVVRPDEGLEEDQVIWFCKMRTYRDSKTLLVSYYNWDKDKEGYVLHQLESDLHPNCIYGSIEKLPEDKSEWTALASWVKANLWD
jgi:hypothetical protein